MQDSFGGAVEEMSEKNILNTICKIEQKLLMEDTSPSVHISETAEEEKQNSFVYFFFYLEK